LSEIAAWLKEKVLSLGYDPVLICHGAQRAPLTTTEDVKDSIRVLQFQMESVLRILRRCFPDASVLLPGDAAAKTESRPM
jgi:hypothetical protein